MRFTVDPSTPLAPLFYEVVLLDPTAARQAVAQEIAARVVPASLADGLEGIVGAWQVAPADGAAWVPESWQLRGPGFVVVPGR